MPASSLSGFLGWLTLHTGFPRHRLPAEAERLLLLAVAAAEEEAGERRDPRFPVKTCDPARDAAHRAHALRRSQVHFKCDNSTKV